MSLKIDPKSAVAALAVGTGLLISAGPAFAAGGGYGPVPPPPAGVPGGFSQVASSQAIGSSGGTMTASSGNQAFKLEIPAGTFSAPTQVTLYTPTDLSAMNGVAGLDIEFSDPSTGASVSQTLTHPITVTIQDPAIQAGYQLEIFSGGKFVPYSQGNVTSGHAVITITQDPVFAILPPSTASTGGSTPSSGSPSTVPGATTVQTGKPFFGELIAAALLVGGGTTGISMIRRRVRRTAA